jgi:hypothetical protein
MTARLYSLGDSGQKRYVRVSAAELDELRRSARNAAAAYDAGFLDGRDRLADELGVTLPPRIRTGEQRIAAEHAALEENVIRLIYRLGRGDAGAGGRHVRPVAGKPGGAA